MPIHGKATLCYIAGVDVSNWLNSIQPSESAEIAETSGFQQDDKTYIQGMDDAKLTLGGRFQAGLLGTEVIIQNQINNQTMPVVTVGFGMGVVPGNPTMFGTAIHATLNATSPTTDVVSIAGDVQFTGGFWDGIFVGASTLFSATGANNGATFDGTVTNFPGTTFAAAMHVIENSRNGTAVVKLQHSTNGSTWVDLVTFPTVAASPALPASFVTVTGPINRYLRVVVTNAGTTGGVRPIVTLGRQ